MKKITVLLALSLSFNLAWADGDRGRHDDCDKQPAQPLNFVEFDVSGRAELCVDDNRLTANLKTANLTQGNAYTVWWVYFDDADNCIGGFPDAENAKCGFADFGPAADPNAVFGRMDSVVAPRKGRSSFSGSWRGMQATEGSEVWFLVFGHGSADTVDGKHLARQTLTPEDPNAGTPHLGIVGIADGGYPVVVAVFGL
jgi:hypothetical protein